MSLKDLLKNKKGHLEVGDLLRLKRQEKPDPAFWEQFEHKLAKKSLRHAMGRGSRRDRFWTFLNAHARLMFAASAAAASVAFVIFGPVLGPSIVGDATQPPAVTAENNPTAPVEAVLAKTSVEPLVQIAEVEPTQAEFPVLAVTSATNPTDAEAQPFERVAARTALRSVPNPETHFVPGLIASSNVALSAAAKPRAAFY
ncbi:MAG: hypothetical protein ACFBZ8_05315 [Opitutales bacterium]